VLYWPVLAVVSFLRPNSPARKAILGATTVFGLFCFLFLSFTGYLLPRGLPRGVSTVEAYQSIRFAVLHLLAAPVIALVVFGLIIWRHSKALKAWGHN
jgi:hypothetical protein